MRPAAAAAVCVTAVALVAGAPAATLTGTSGPDRLLGTNAADTIRGKGGDDRIEGRDGPDSLDAGNGSDRVLAGGGDDRLSTSGDGYDSVACGSGRDVAVADLTDAVAADCETVTRQLSRDPYTNRETQHASEVEPDSFSWGSTVVTAFQVGRSFADGSANIGFSTSRNAGRTWTSGFLPALTERSRPAGPSPTAADSSVAYDAVHRTWLIASIGVGGDEAGGEDRLLVSRSPNGLAWRAPVVAARAADAFDKPWIACDNWTSSRFRGRCYLSYLDVRNGRIQTRHSTNAGATWSPAVSTSTAAGEQFQNGAQPIALPSGALLVLYSSFGVFAGPGDHIAAVRSADGGASFSGERVVAPVEQSIVLGLRTVSFPSVEIDGAGKIYAVWQDCGVVPDCASNGVAMTTSTDGLRWSDLRLVPTGRTEAGTHYFLPAVGVDRTTRLTSGRVAVAYYSLPLCEPSFCPGIDVGLVSSTNGGATWSAPERLDVESMSAAWIADTGYGRMLADYISLSYAGARPIPVFSLALPPAGGRLRQSIYATTRLPPARPSGTKR